MATAGDPPVTQVGLKLQSQDIFYLSHGQPRCWHLALPQVGNKTGQNIVGLSRVRIALTHSLEGWQTSPESVAAFEWNQWQAYSGMGGSFAMESVAAFDRNMQIQEERGKALDAFGKAGDHRLRCRRLLMEDAAPRYVDLTSNRPSWF